MSEPHPAPLPAGAYITLALLAAFFSLLIWLVANYPGNPPQRSDADDCEAITQQYRQGKRDSDPTSDRSAAFQNEKSTPQNAVSNQTKNDIDAERQIAKYNCQLAIYTRDVASFTKYLVVATIVLGAIGIGQGVILRRSVRVADRAAIEARDAIRAAQTSADAAMLRAKAAIYTDKPFVYATNVTLSLAPKGRDDAIMQTIYYLTITFTNYGRSPAFVIDIGTGEMRSRDLPEIPRYSDMRYTGLVINPLGGTYVHSPYALVVVTDSDKERIMRGEMAHWIWGRIRYKDFMGGETEYGFIGIHDSVPTVRNGTMVREPQFIFGINREGVEAYHYERYRAES